MSVAHHAANSRVLAPSVDGRQRVPSCECNDLFAPAEKEQVGADDKRAGSQLGKRPEGRVDLARSACAQDMQLEPERTRALL